jgi:uncharacterized protein (DUF58 family)
VSKGAELLFTRKSVGYFFLGAALLMLALVLEDWQLAILVLPLASMFFLTNSFSFPEKVHVELDQKIIPYETFGDEEIRVIAEVRNKGDARLDNVEIGESLPSGMAPEKGASHVYASMLSGESVELSMEFKDPGRGHYTIGPLTVRVRDSFGLYLDEERLEPETLAVMPRPERIRGTELRPRHVGPWAGTIPSRVSGVGTEFFSLREYEPGDDMKRVNWKATAHSNQLIVNEMESERVTDVMLVLDTDVTFYESSERDLFERGVKAAASMSSLLLRQGNRVGLILQGEERGIVSPGFGKRQERKILYKLASARPGTATVPTGYVMNLLARLMLPSRAVIVIISPLLDPSITDGIRRLVAAGYSVIALAPSAMDPQTYASDSERVAFGIARLERANVLLAVEKVCTLIQWSAGVPLSRRLREARRVRPPLRI